MRRRLVVALALVPLACGRLEEPQPLHVAVAANFRGTAEGLARRFTAETGRAVELTPGATGALAAQIQNGAPFDVFLAADAERPALLAREGLGIAETRRTVALGRLVLCGSALADGADGAAVLAAGGFRSLAIANPETAPYGAAALEVLASLGLAEALADTLVVGESVAQAFHWAATGSAELAFVALAQWREAPPAERAALVGVWDVPADRHAPIRQDGIVLAGADADARAFLAFLGGERARAAIEAAGYGTVDE